MKHWVILLMYSSRTYPFNVFFHIHVCTVIYFMSYGFKADPSYFCMICQTFKVTFITIIRNQDVNLTARLSHLIYTVLLISAHLHRRRPFLHVSLLTEVISSWPRIHQKPSWWRFVFTFPDFRELSSLQQNG